MDKKKITKLFNNIFVEINTNHDEAVSVYERYLQQGSNPKVLVNFDSHSDLSTNYKIKEKTIANWVNFCIKQFDIDEFYWVVPEHIIQNEQEFLKDKNNIPNTNFFCFKNMKLNPLENNSGYIYYSKKTNELRHQENVEHINKKCEKYGLKPIINEDDNKKIKVTILTENKLEKLKGKEILLSVDADYFCNTGHDTTSKINNNNITKEELLNKFDSFINALYENDIQIKCCSLTYSPIYFPNRFKKEIEEFYKEIKG